METIKLKILDEVGHTLMTCDADTNVSLVYTNSYKPGDRVALEIDHPGQYCVIQFEDTMPEALVYVVKREINFHIPFGEQAILLAQKLCGQPPCRPRAPCAAGRNCCTAELSLQLLR